MNIKEGDQTTQSHQNKPISQDLLLTQKQMNVYKQDFDKQSLQKKKQYLHAIQEHNNTLINKIKEFDQQVNAEVNALAKKIVPKKKMIIPKFQEIQSESLKQKFQQMEKLKRQLQSKQTGTDSLQFLLIVKKKYEIKLSNLKKDVHEKKKQIQHLKKIKEKALVEDNALKNQITKLGDLDIFSSEIDILRQKVRDKNDNLKAKKEEFLSLYKKNRSNRSIIIQSSPKEEKQIEQDPQLLQLKQQYENIGKRVDILKLKKANLLSQIKTDSQARKNLERLKAKHDSSRKVTK